ncbi:MAG: hypothetical protein KC994_02195 [Candidatus Omnitrophica bacterium]|nr:hypothetical protein [Candidatus Omnitrophota bacterium]
MRQSLRFLTGFSFTVIALIGCAPSPRTYSDSPNRTNWAALYGGNNHVTKEILRGANDPAQDLRPEWDRRQEAEWEKENVDLLDVWCAGKQVIENMDRGPNLYSDPALNQPDF